MDLPKSLSDLAILSKLHAGTVLRTRVYFEDGADDIKLLIVLTNNNDHLVLNVTTTSNTSKLNRAYSVDDIFVPKDSEPAFNRPTVVQLNRLIPFETETIKTNYHIHELSIIGQVSDELLKNILERVKNSRILLKSDVKRILEENESST